MDSGSFLCYNKPMGPDETARSGVDKLGESSISTVQATAENFSESEIVKLMKQFRIDTFNPMGEFNEGTRAKIRSCLEKTSDEVLLKDGLRPADEDVDENEHRLFREFTEDFQRDVGNMKRLVAEGNVEIIVEGKEVIAAIAVRNLGKLEDKRDVYEFTKAVVMPRCRGRGLFAVLKESLTKRMRKANPSVPLASVTEKPAIKKYCESHGWQERDLDFFADIMCRRSDFDSVSKAYIRQWYDDKKAKPGWKGFIDDPLDPKL